MRSLATSLLALIVSLLVGGIIVQVLAVMSGGHEEWIVAFGMTILVAAAATLVFLIAQWASGTKWVTGIVALALLVVFAFLVGLMIWAAFAENPEPPRSQLNFMAGLVLPGGSIIFVQWLIVRWRAPREAGLQRAPRFGRGGQL